jgi:hypothetical protein
MTPRAARLPLVRVALASAALAGCARAAPAAPSPASEVTQAEWTLSRVRLAAARARQPRGPYAERVHVTLTEPVTGKRFEARGAVAVDPERAARMILLGPGGTTAVDVWVTPERFRVAVPAIHFERRGGHDLEVERGLPVGMLRWWFLAPLSGRLLMARSSAHESSFLLRDGAATVMLRTDGQRFLAVRRQDGRSEAISWSAGVPRAAEGHGRYVDGASGLRVDVRVEELMATEPDPAAFAEPDVPAPAAREGTSL